MSLNELLEEIFDTDVISLEDYMNRINEVENFFLNNGNSEWKTYYRGDKFCGKTQSNFFRFGDIKEEGKKFKKWKERHLDLCNKYDDEFMRLGKMVYYSLSDVLIDLAEFEKIRAACNIGGRAGTRISAANAFRAATGDVKGRVEIGGYSGKVYFRDNKQRKGWISRELVMEEPDDHTNLYTKVANVVFNRNTEALSLENVSGASPVNAQDFYVQVCDLYEKYRRCVNRRQVETVATNILAEMNAIKIQTHGHMYFVPRSSMTYVSMFEDFIETLDKHTQNEGSLVVNSLFVVNDEKQRQKMTSDFYAAIRKEIEMYDESVRHLIDTGCQSAAIMNRWIAKIKALNEKRRMYENLFRDQLNEVNGEFSTLQGLSQELQIRVNSSLLKKCA